MARQDLEPGIVVGGELRDPERLTEALREFFTKNNLPSRDVRLGDREQQDRRPDVRDHRHRRPEPARERDSLPRPGDASDPDRGCGPRLPRSWTRPRRGADGASSASCSSSPTGSSSTATSPPAARRHRARRHRPGSVRAAPGDGARRARTRPASGARRRRGRPRAFDVCSLRRSRVRVRPRARVGRLTR